MRKLNDQEISMIERLKANSIFYYSNNNGYQDPTCHYKFSLFTAFVVYKELALDFPLNYEFDFSIQNCCLDPEENINDLHDAFSQDIIIYNSAHSLGFYEVGNQLIKLYKNLGWDVRFKAEALEQLYLNAITEYNHYIDDIYINNESINNQDELWPFTMFNEKWKSFFIFCENHKIIQENELYQKLASICPKVILMDPFWQDNSVPSDPYFLFSMMGFDGEDEKGCELLNPFFPAEVLLVEHYMVLLSEQYYELKSFVC